MPSRTSQEIEARILAARLEHRFGQDRLAVEVGVPPRTVSRVLRRHGMPRLCTLDPLTGALIRSSKTTAVRYERDRPGELVHMDVKKIGRIPDGGGWRAHGRQMSRTWKNKTTKVGYDYVHSVVDDHSRFAYPEILPDEQGATCAAFLARAAEYFVAHGITDIQAVMTDNAWNYTHSRDMAVVLAQLGATLTPIKAHCPWQNGKAERYNRTLADEWAYRRVYTSNDDRAGVLPDFLDYYNQRRPHSALGGQPPISRLS